MHYKLSNKDNELHDKVTTVQNAKVGMPILSLNGLAKEKNNIVLDEDFGTIIQAVRRRIPLRRGRRGVLHSYESS